MVTTFKSGQALPPVGSAAYAAAQDGNGSGSYNPATGGLRVTPSASPTVTPATQPTPNPAPTGTNPATKNPVAPATAPIIGATPGGETPAEANDQGFQNANQELNTQPMSEDQIYAYYAGKSGAAIDAVNETAAAAEQSANTQLNKDVSASNADAARRGMVGAGSNIANEAAVTNSEQAIATARATRDTNLASIMQTVTSEAATKFAAQQARADTNSQNYQTTFKANEAQNLATGKNYVASLAKNGSTLDEAASQDPQGFQAMLNYYGGNKSLMTADWIASNAANEIDGGKPIQAGTSLIYTFRDPMTGKVFTQSVDTGIPLNPDWATAKAGDGSIIQYNKSTGQALPLGGGNPVYLANQELTAQSKQQSIKASTARQVQSILRSTGLLSGAAGSGAGGSIPAKFYNAATIMDRIDAASAAGSNAVSDEDIIDALVSINTGGGRPTQAQFDQIVQSIGAEDKAGVMYNKYVNNSSQFLPADIKSDAITLAKNNFQNLQKSKDAWDKTASDILAKNGITPDQYNITTDDTFLNPPTTQDTSGSGDVTSQLTSLGAEDNGDGTWTMSDGTVVTPD